LQHHVVRFGVNCLRSPTFDFFLAKGKFFIEIFLFIRQLLDISGKSYTFIFEPRDGGF
jgi:hypothetical protein